MRKRRSTLSLSLIVCLLAVTPAHAFLEDLCLPRRNNQGVLSWCIRPECPLAPNRACPAQLADFGTIQPGRSMIHADSTYFIALALGYRPDVAYWITAYNEVTDFGKYEPIDQCGVPASSSNSGRNYMAAPFDGFKRTNNNTDGPLDHYIVNFSPNGQGTDVHGAGGVQALYPFHYPKPGYPVRIDDTYQKTLANLRQWAMIPTDDPGLLCTVGLTQGNDQCLTGQITGTVPLIMASTAGVPLNVPAGRKVLNWTSATDIDYYDELGAYLKDPDKTTGTLWMDRQPRPVPVQIARIGLYLHALQDASSHATYCGDNAPSPPGGGDPGTYMYLTNDNQVNVVFGSSCAASPHLASHIQETGTGDNPLPLRVYVALNNTLDELIVFGNSVARQHGWIANPELLPPDLERPNGQGQNAAQLKATLVGTIVSGTPYSRAEVYKSGVVTLPLQQTNSLNRLHAMNAALAEYGEKVRKASATPAAFVPFKHMPGNSANPRDTSVCWAATSGTSTQAP